MSVLGLMFLLSAIDGWSIAQWAFNFIVAIVMAHLARQNQRIDHLQESLRLSAEKQIEDRFVGLTREMTSHLSPLLKAIDATAGRIKESEECLDDLITKDHELEMKMFQRVENLRGWMGQNFASREEQKQIAASMEKIRDKLSNLDQMVSHVENERRRS